MKTIKLTALELDTLIEHFEQDLGWGVDGTWGDGEGFSDDKGNIKQDPTRRTKRGETILRKLQEAR